MTATQAQPLHPNAEWFTTRHPDAARWVTEVDPRTWQVLGVLGHLHNLLDHKLPHHGVRQAGDGIKALIRGDLSTFDGDELTRLVIAGHELACRVSIHPTYIHGARVQDPDYDYDYGWERLIDMYEPDLPEYWAGEDMEADPLLETICHAPVGPEGQTECGSTLRRQTLTSDWVHAHYHDPEDIADIEALEDLEDDHGPEPAPLIVEPITGYLWVQVVPREIDADHLFHRHPTLDKLQDRIQKRIDGPGA